MLHAGAQLKQALNASAVGYNSDDTGYNADIKLLPADGDDVVVALAPSTDLGVALRGVAAHLFKVCVACCCRFVTLLALSRLCRPAAPQTEPVRKLFTRWVLDGKVESEPPGTPQPATVEDVASRILQAEDSRASLVATVFGAQAGRTVPITAPRALADRMQLFFTNGTFKAPRGNDTLTGDDARAALIAWAAEQLAAQAARRAELAAAFEEAYSEFHGVHQACGHSLLYGMGYFILGPRDDYQLRDLEDWSTNKVAPLMAKGALVRAMLPWL